MGSGNLPSSPFEQQQAQAYSPAKDAMQGMKVVVVGGGNGGEVHLANGPGRTVLSHPHQPLDSWPAPRPNFPPARPPTRPSTHNLQA